MPAEYDEDELPEPNNSSVKIDKDKKKIVAAIQFGGWADQEDIDLYKAKLIKLLKKNKLRKYEEIQEGDKIKFIVLREPNPIREKVISFPTRLPKEFNLHEYIDFDEQFDKSFLEPLRFIVNAINWNFEKQATLDNFF